MKVDDQDKANNERQSRIVDDPTLITGNNFLQDLQDDMNDISKSELWKPTSVTPVQQQVEKADDFQANSFAMLAGKAEGQNIQITGTAENGFKTAVMPDGTPVYIMDNVQMSL